MKGIKIFSVLLFYIILLLSVNYSYAADPCCGIIKIDKKNGIVTARNKETGRTFQFKVDALEIGSLKVGDPVEADLKKNVLQSIKGITRTYAVFEPAFAEPCCPIVNIQPDPAEPINRIITVRTKVDQNTLQFRAPKKIISKLKIGQAIFIDESNEWAYIQSSAESEGGKRIETYSFPVLKQSKWDLIPNKVLKGPTGRIVINPPGKAVYEVKILKAGTDEVINQGYKLKEVRLLPGMYDIIIPNYNSGWGLKNVPVKQGMDTRINTGTLNVSLPNSNWKIFDESKKEWVTQGYSTWMIGLPIGKYFVQIGNDFVEIEIRNGEITEL